MFTVKALLVPTDFSDNASQALQYAKEIAKGTQATLHVVHIVEPVVYPADWSYAQVGFADIEQELQENAEKELKTLSEALQAEGYKVVTAVRRGAMQRITTSASSRSARTDAAAWSTSCSAAPQSACSGKPPAQYCRFVSMRRRKPDATVQNVEACHH
jgi:nucleotide-binding universal stress UspA family protein